MACQFLTILKSPTVQKEQTWNVVVSSKGKYDVIKNMPTQDDAKQCALTLASEKKLVYVGPTDRLVTVYPIGNCYVVAYQNMPSGQVIGNGIAQEDFLAVYDEAQQLAKKDQLAFVPFLFVPLFNMLPKALASSNLSSHSDDGT